MNDDAKSVQMQSASNSADAPTTLSPTAEGQIAVGLKQLYGQMLAEPMPDKFVDLLSALAKADGKSEERS